MKPCARGHQRDAGYRVSRYKGTQFGKGTFRRRTVQIRVDAGRSFAGLQRKVPEAVLRLLLDMNRSGNIILVKTIEATAAAVGQAIDAGAAGNTWHGCGNDAVLVVVREVLRRDLETLKNRRAVIVHALYLASGISAYSQSRPGLGPGHQQGEAGEDQC